MTNMMFVLFPCSTYDQLLIHRSFDGHLGLCRVCIEIDYPLSIRVESSQVDKGGGTWPYGQVQEGNVPFLGQSKGVRVRVRDE